MADARKKKEKGKSGTRETRDAGRGGWGTEASAANLLFISSFSFTGERKITIGSFLIMRQSLPGTTFWLVKMFLEAMGNEKMADARKRDMEAKFEQILKEILLELEDKGRKITVKDELRKAVKQLYW